MQNRYGITVTWSEADKGFIATVPEFPGLSAFGETREEAVQEAQVALELFIEEMQESGEPLPAYKKKKAYSGNIRLRLTRSLHQQLAEYAEDEGVSMNAMIATLLAQSLAQEKTMRIIHEHIDCRLDAITAVGSQQTSEYFGRIQAPAHEADPGSRALSAS